MDLSGYFKCFGEVQVEAGLFGGSAENPMFM